MIFLASIIAIAILIAWIFLKAALYGGKIKKAYREKNWDALPKLIFLKHAVFGLVLPGRYFRDELKYVATTGKLFAQSSAQVIAVCEKRAMAEKSCGPISSCGS